MTQSDHPALLQVDQLAAALAAEGDALKLRALGRLVTRLYSDCDREFRNAQHREEIAVLMRSGPLEFESARVLLDQLREVPNAALLERRRTGPEGTFGVLTVKAVGREPMQFATAELPWKGNERNVSCIPAGQYLCEFGPTGKTVGGMSSWYHVRDVSGRSGILIHVGNWAGDKSAGYHTDSEGCILAGLSFGKLPPPGHSVPQQCVLHSRDACTQLHDYFEPAPFMLEILERYDNA